MPTRVPATPAEGPRNPAPPAGEVILDTTAVASLAVVPGLPGADGGPSGGADAGDGAVVGGGADRRGASTGSLVVQQSRPEALTVYSLGANGPADTPVRSIEIPEGAARATVVDGAGGPVALVPAPGRLVRANLSTGRKTSVELDGDPVSATGLPDGGYAVGTAGGTVYLLDADLQVRHEVTGFVSADALVDADDALVVFDAHQTSVTVVDPDTGEKGAALRVGKGATRIIADGTGHVIAADTAGGQLLVFGVDPLVDRQMAPIGDSPVALAEDAERGLVWVTLTGTDEVAAFDLSLGEPVEKYRFPTVAHPTSVAVGADGSVYVGSGAHGGVARIAPEEIG